MTDEDIEIIMARVDMSDRTNTTSMTARAEADLLRIKRGTLPARQKTSIPRRRTAVIAIASTVIAATLVGTSLTLIQPSPNLSIAASPNVLPVEGSAPPFDDAMDDAISRLRTNGSYSTVVSRGAKYLRWDEADDVRSNRGTSNGAAITYDYVVFDWDTDLSGHRVVTARTEFVTNSPIPASTSAPDGSEVIDDEVFAAGTVQVAYVNAPPKTKSDMARYLNDSKLPESNGIPGTLGRVAQLLSEWSLSQAEEVAVLEVLRDERGFEPLGKVTDRLGRSGYAYSLDIPSGAGGAVLVVSPESGRVLSIESVVRPTLGATNDAPRVVRFMAWE